MTAQVDHAVVGVLVEQDRKFLLVRESKPGREGLYNTPGGHVEPHETLFESALREESGYEIELTGLLTVHQTILPHINVSGPVFAARVVGGEARPTDEHPEVRWFSIEELRQLEADKRLFTVYPVYAAELLLAGKLLPLDTVVCMRAG